MIADCETCYRKKVPCKSCQESQRAICFICQGDVADPYGELDGPEMSVTPAGILALPEYERDNCISREA